MSESFAALFEESLQRAEMRAGEVITAEVVRIEHNFVVVNAGLKSEAYVPVDEFKNDQGDVEVQESVVEYEPHGAVFSGADGLDDLREIVADAREWLVPGGWLVVEAGYRQCDAVRELMVRAGFVASSITIHSDLTPHPRYLSAQSGAELHAHG